MYIQLLYLLVSMCCCCTSAVPAVSCAAYRRLVCCPVRSSTCKPIVSAVHLVYKAHGISDQRDNATLCGCWYHWAGNTGCSEDSSSTNIFKTELLMPSDLSAELHTLPTADLPMSVLKASWYSSILYLQHCPLSNLKLPFVVSQGSSIELKSHSRGQAGALDSAIHCFMRLHHEEDLGILLRT